MCKFKRNKKRVHFNKEVKAIAQGNGCYDRSCRMKMSQWSHVTYQSSDLQDTQVQLDFLTNPSRTEWDRMEWDRTGLDLMRWDGTGRDGTGPDGQDRTGQDRLDGIEWNGVEQSREEWNEGREKKRRKEKRRDRILTLLNSIEQ